MSGYDTEANLSMEGQNARQGSKNNCTKGLGVYRDSVQAETMPGDGRGFTSRTWRHRSHSACIVKSAPSTSKVTNRGHAKLFRG